MNSLQSVIDRLPSFSSSSSGRRPRPPPHHAGAHQLEPHSPYQVPASSLSQLQLLRGTGGPPPTIEAFNRKLTETDSYLQILINQFAGLKLEERIQNCGSSEAEREQLRSLKELSVYLLDSIKHTIVLLQIAKVRSSVQFS